MKNNENMKLWENFRSVPDEAKKPIVGHPKLKGMTDINPVWRQKKLTEIFGPVGFGWYTETIKEWTEPGANGEILFFVKINLYVKYDGEWSKPIEGQGGNKLINKYSKGLDSNDEALKMAYTDALSVACKPLGIAADVYFEKDRTKYDIYDDYKETIKKSTPNQIAIMLDLVKNCGKNIEKFKDSIQQQAKVNNLFDLTYDSAEKINILLKDEYRIQQEKKYKQAQKPAPVPAQENKQYKTEIDGYRKSAIVTETKPTKKVSQAQLKRMFAIMNQAGQTEENVNAFIKTKFKKESKKELSQEEYKYLCDRLEIKAQKEATGDELPLTTPKSAQPAEPVK